MFHPIPAIIIFSIYFLIILVIGITSSFVTKNMADYVLGSRHLSGVITALGVGASDMGGWLLLALPGAVYLTGMQAFWMPVGLVIGAYINWKIVAKRLRIYSEKASNSLTLPAYFDNRFNDNTGILRSVSAAAVLIFFTFYTAAGFVGGAVLLQTIFGISYHSALILDALFVVVYTAIGGFLAVSWVDFFQGSLMFFALVIVPVVTFFHIGIHNTFPLIQAIKPEALNPLKDTSFITVISLMAWGLGYFGQPHILVRFMAIRSVKELPIARKICMTWMTVALLGAVATGLVGIAYFQHQGLADAETVFLELSNRLFNPWVASILFAAVLSATISSIAAQLLVSSSALSEDFYRRFFRRQAGRKELMVVSRSTLIIIALFAISLAYYPHNTILNLVGYAWAGLGASFGPIVIFSLFWKNMTRNAAVIGIITGALTVIIWKQLSYLGGIFTVYELLPAFIFSSASIIIVSLLDKVPAENILQEFKAVKATIQE